MLEYELADVSIVSHRIQRRPEGISLSSTLPSETDSQPTRTMKESMESLPGIVLRQANGPRDLSISIRGSGVKTSFAARDLKIYEDGVYPNPVRRSVPVGYARPLVYAQCRSPARGLLVVV